LPLDRTMDSAKMDHMIQMNRSKGTLGHPDRSIRL
jgi:hypothetical protein